MRGCNLITIAQNATTQQNIQTSPYILSFANTFNIILIIQRAFDIKNYPICFASNLKIYDHFKNEVSKIRKGPYKQLKP